jgi:hypothetical protein
MAWGAVGRQRLTGAGRPTAARAPGRRRRGARGAAARLRQRGGQLAVDHRVVAARRADDPQLGGRGLMGVRVRFGWGWRGGQGGGGRAFCTSCSAASGAQSCDAGRGAHDRPRRPPHRHGGTQGHARLVEAQQVLRDDAGVAGRVGGDTGQGGEGAPVARTGQDAAGASPPPRPSAPLQPTRGRTRAPWRTPGGPPPPGGRGWRLPPKPPRRRRRP